jgi:4'-phosphopantetheinyl transferase
MVSAAGTPPEWKKAVSVSDIPYPGNEAARPRPLPNAIAGIRLFWCELDNDDDALRVLAGWLSPPEHARAARYGQAALARRYVAGRAALRWVLGTLLGTAPRAVAIERGERGRPRLANNASIDFNVSNTRNVAVVAVCETPGLRVGVDVEHGERALNHSLLARKFLTTREQAALRALPDDARRRAFLRAWTCKEAMSKATGDALSAPLARLDVRLAPVLQLVDGPAPYVPQHWSLAAVGVPAPYLATLAIWDERHNMSDPDRSMPGGLDTAHASR